MEDRRRELDRSLEPRDVETRPAKPFGTDEVLARMRVALSSAARRGRDWVE